MTRGVRRGSERDLRERLTASKDNVARIRKDIRECRAEIRDYQDQITAELTLQAALTAQLEARLNGTTEKGPEETSSPETAEGPHRSTGRTRRRTDAASGATRG